jgi:opacity protein-like surface antigen
MRRALFAVSCMAAVMTSAAMAEAQDSGGAFPRQGAFVLGGERLTGLYFYSIKTERTIGGGPLAGGKTDVDYSGTEVNLLWGGTAGAYSGAGIANPAAIPRLGFDYFVTDLISVGGSLGYSTASGEQKVNGASEDLPSYSAFLFNPRVGFGIPISDIVVFWPRVGITYWRFHTESEDVNTKQEGTLSGLALTAEGMFVISPVPHFGFGVGPLIDLGLSGTAKGEATDKRSGLKVSGEDDYKVTNFGAIAGLVGTF